MFDWLILGALVLLLILTYTALSAITNRLELISQQMEDDRDLLIDIKGAIEGRRLNSHAIERDELTH